MATQGRTDVQLESVTGEAESKETEAAALKTCAGTVGAAGAVAVAMNPGSMAVAAFLVGNSQEVEKNARELLATRDSFAGSLEAETTLADALLDRPGDGITRSTWT
jgi:hypothetical protein